MKIFPLHKSWTPALRVATVTALLGVHAALAFFGILNRSVTSDETGHLTAGYAYWRFGDYRLQPENGNLPQRWGSLPLLIAQPRLDPASNRNDWAASRVWNIGQRFFFESGNNTDLLLLCARSVMLSWSVAAGLLVFWWARSLWGDAGAIGALALFAFSPTTLAHAPLVTSDMCAAVCLLAAVGTWWRMCQQPTPGRILLAGAVTGLAFVAKFSAVLLLPVFAGIGVITLALHAFGRSVRPEQSDTKRAFGPMKLGGTFLLAALIAIIVIWGFFGFRFRAANPSVAGFAQFYLPWETLLSKDGVLTGIIQFARRFQVLPEALIYGFSFVVYFSGERGAFLAGNYSTTGWWWFFPFAFLVKSTIGELFAALLLAIQGLGLVRKLESIGWRTLLSSSLVPLMLFALVFSAVSLASNLNIGQRHILPLYLILFIAAGVLFSVRSPRIVRVLGTAAILLSAFETVSNHPNHLAFFNRLAGGPQNGWRLLVDSSLDWGQDVSALGSWVQKNRRPHERVYFSCFGTADPEYEGIKGELLSPYYSLGRPRYWFELQPGLYCLSATMLQDVYGIRPGAWTVEMEKDFQYLKTAARTNVPNGTWSQRLPDVGHHPEHPLWLLDRLRFARLCQYLKVRKPDAVINYTQFVFRLSPEELATFSDRPFSALAALMQASQDSPANPNHE